MAIVTQSVRSVGTGNRPADQDWRHALKTAVRDPRLLCRMLDLPVSLERAAVRAAGSFGLFAPLAYIEKMQPGDPDDPLLRQVLPLAEEEATAAGFAADPVGDAAATLQPGLIKKYLGRALLIASGACAVHCRYCFRRHFPYGEAPHSPQDWQCALDQIAADGSIDEVLLSGGDPLMLSDDHLALLVGKLANIAHLRRLRIHTRLPIMIPQRVTDDLTAMLRGGRLTPLVVVHANHAAELDDDVADALSRLVDAGIVVLNQSVLLRGVNDRLEVLSRLCRRLVDLRVMPYYLHQLDRVAGAAHFEVPVARGVELIERLRAELPGYAVPRFVREVAGRASKQVLA